MKLTKAQLRYLAEAHPDNWMRANNPPRVAMWRKLHAMGLLEKADRTFGSVARPVAVYRLTPSGLKALTDAR